MRILWCFLALSVLAISAYPNSIPKKAPSCDPAQCLLPNCRCSDTSVPGGHDPANIPQIILLTFDDAITKLNYNDYYKPLLFNRTNPNGCQAKATFFLSHEYADYTLAHDLFARGHDIASHSISHISNQTYWAKATSEDYRREMVDMRTIASTFAMIPEETIVGTRIPFLQLGGNTMFETLNDYGFTWDCTWTSRNNVDPGMWPYTLDFLSKQDCQIGTCPDESYPGFWVVPMLDLTDKLGFPCAMLDTCTRPDNAEETYDLLKKNFDMHYSDSNRSPYGLYLHAAWFAQPGTWEGYVRFINEVNEQDDVYFVTITELIEWVKNPTTLDTIKEFAPWKTNCDKRFDNKCGKGFSCHYSTSPLGGERYMQSCVECPNNYPWMDNPTGA